MNKDLDPRGIAEALEVERAVREGTAGPQPTVIPDASAGAAPSATAPSGGRIDELIDDSPSSGLPPLPSARPRPSLDTP